MNEADKRRYMARENIVKKAEDIPYAASGQCAQCGGIMSEDMFDRYEKWIDRHEVGTPINYLCHKCIDYRRKRLKEGRLDSRGLGFYGGPYGEAGRYCVHGRMDDNLRDHNLPRPKPLLPG